MTTLIVFFEDWFVLWTFVLSLNLITSLTGNQCSAVWMDGKAEECGWGGDVNPDPNNPPCRGRAASTMPLTVALYLAPVQQQFTGEPVI